MALLGQGRDARFWRFRPSELKKNQVRDGSFQYSSLPKAVTGINIAAKVANRRRDGQDGHRPVEIPVSRWPGLRSATFHATKIVSDPVFRAAAAGRVDLGAVKEVYPLEKGVELGGQIAAGPESVGAVCPISRKTATNSARKGTFTVEELGLTLSKPAGGAHPPRRGHHHAPPR